MPGAGEVGAGAQEPLDGLQEEAEGWPLQP